MTFADAVAKREAALAESKRHEAEAAQARHAAQRAADAERAKQPATTLSEALGRVLAPPATPEPATPAPAAEPAPDDVADARLAELDVLIASAGTEAAALRGTR